MSAPLSVALVEALASNPDALDQLAAALAPLLAAREDAALPTGALTTGQAATSAGVHERTIRRALAAGTLNGHTIAGRWRIDLNDLADWLHAGAPTSAAPTRTANGRRCSSATSAGADAIAGRRTR